MTILLKVDGLHKTYSHGLGRLVRHKVPPAVHNVSFSIEAGSTFGLVGESGSGKSSTARIVTRLEHADSGSVLLNGEDLLAARGKSLLRVRRQVQMVFQDPFASLDPRWTVEQLVCEGMRIHGIGTRSDRKDRVITLLEQVGLDSSAANRLPHQFSGGQRQRIGIARALAVDPDLLVLDEPVSALDVSIQAQILNLLTDLQKQRGLTYLFISHDLAIVERFCSEVAVMKNGEIVEQAAADELFRNPQHEYTRTLLAAIPIPDPTLRRGNDLALY
ncbi:ATP-binding cassette domain-containing protein [Pseudarthrobacter sp. TAF60_1]|uniref:ATP-binding cassette domain-containing protein n=1 Tax=Pseudarthrobacter sp. TAF60_1 TaxID=3233071 RepID=UPI003F9C5D4B